MLSAPTRMAPAASSRWMTVASAFAGGASRLILAPASVASPAISKRIFTGHGTPSDLEEVLHRERHAGEGREGFAPRAGLIERPGTRRGALLGDRGEGVE